MTAAGYHAWAVLDIEPSAHAAPSAPSASSTFSTASAALRRGVLQSLVTRSLAATAIPEVGVIPGPVADRLVLGFVPDTPLATIGGAFVEALAVRLDEHNNENGVDAFRLTAVLHDAWVDGAFAEILRLADAPVLGRVRAAARRASMVIAVSEAWHAELLRGARGYSRVRSAADTFWIRVPGTSAPPGLRPPDVSFPPASSPGARAGRA